MDIRGTLNHQCVGWTEVTNLVTFLLVTCIGVGLLERVCCLLTGKNDRCGPVRLATYKLTDGRYKHVSIVTALKAELAASVTELTQL